MIKREPNRNVPIRNQIGELEIREKLHAKVTDFSGIQVGELVKRINAFLKNKPASYQKIYLHIIGEFIEKRGGGKEVVSAITLQHPEPKKSFSQRRTNFSESHSNKISLQDTNLQKEFSEKFEKLRKNSSEFTSEFSGLCLNVFFSKIRILRAEKGRELIREFEKIMLHAPNERKKTYVALLFGMEEGVDYFLREIHTNPSSHEDAGRYAHAMGLLYFLLEKKGSYELIDSVYKLVEDNKDNAWGLEKNIIRLSKAKGVKLPEIH